MSISRSASSYLTLSSPGSLEPPFAAWDESEIVGSSAAMKRVRQQVRRIGPHFRTVLVSGEAGGGEAGAGKQLVARALHRMSPASDGPFVVCHATAIEDALAECEGGASTTDDV